MHVVLTDFDKTLICKRNYDVMLWRNTHRLYSNNDHHTPLLKTRICYGACNQEFALGVVRPLHATERTLVNPWNISS